MNRRVLIVLLAIVSLHSCKDRGDTAVVVTPVDTVQETLVDTVPRTSITFIMGTDNYSYNQYYTMADHYYRINPDDRTEVVVGDITSLKQVLDYLRDNPPANERPYGLINLVSHGNEFIDLQATVTPRGARISPQSIAKALADSILAVPDTTLVDSRTQVYLHGCAVGHNQALLDGLADAFGGRAVVKASKLFEYYAYLSPNKNPQSIRHYFARTWYAFYHPDSVFHENRLVRQLRRSYPHDTTRWREGLRRRIQENPSQLYHYSFVVSCSYSEIYGSLSNVPNVNSRSGREQWIAEHKEYGALLDSMRIPRKYFQNKFYMQVFEDGDSILYGLRVKSRAGVVCLIQPLVAAPTPECKYNPYVPDHGDTAIFAFSKNYHVASEPAETEQHPYFSPFIWQRNEILQDMAVIFPTQS